MQSRELTELQKIHQAQLREKREAIKQRKARTRRLIVRGAMVEAMIPGADSMTEEEFQEMLFKALGRAHPP